MKTLIVVGLFESVGYARDVCNRLHTEGVSEDNCAHMRLKEIDLVASTSLRRPRGPGSPSCRLTHWSLAISVTGSPSSSATARLLCWSAPIARRTPHLLPMCCGFSRRSRSRCSRSSRPAKPTRFPQPLDFIRAE